MALTPDPGMSPEWHHRRVLPSQAAGEGGEERSPAELRCWDGSSQTPPSAATGNRQRMSRAPGTEGREGGSELSSLQSLCEARLNSFVLAKAALPAD